MQPTVDGVRYGEGLGRTLPQATEDAARITFRRLLFKEAISLIQRRLDDIP